MLVAGREGSWDAGQVTHPIVLKEDDGYRMYYTGFDADATPRIGLATSQDGMTWTKYDNPAIPETPFAESDPVLNRGAAGDWDEDAAERDRVVKTPEGYVMVYRAAVGNRSGRPFGLATSRDGVTWTKYRGNPILEPGSLGDVRGPFFPTFVYHEDRYDLYLEGFAGSSKIYLFTHEDDGTLFALEETTSNLVVETLVEELPSATGGVAVDKAGTIYVGNIGSAPRRGNQVFKITPDGEVRLFAKGENLLGASGNAFDSQGYLFQSNFSNNSVSKISPSGEVSTFITEGISKPVGIAMDKEDNLYIANCGSASIQFVTAEGASSVFASSPLFCCPNGVALDNDGNVYVANF